jgi:hypothetical protein
MWVKGLCLLRVIAKSKKTKVRKTIPLSVAQHSGLSHQNKTQNDGVRVAVAQYNISIKKRMMERSA